MSATRRDFLRATASTAGGYLLVATFGIPSEWARAQTVPANPPPATALSPSVFIRIDPDGSIRILAARPDMGQGIKTSAAMTIADELDADWSRVTVEQAPANSAIYGSQTVGGSRSTPASWDALRLCGATARAMLVTAAANSWNVPAAECSTSAGTVTHAASARRLTYGALAAIAATLPVPDAVSVKLKSRGDYRIVGQPTRSVDVPKIVSGEPLYAMDVRLPRMKYAAIARGPALRSKPASGNFDEVRRLPGVLDVFAIDGQGAGPAEAVPFVAIIASSTWAAFRARRALKIDWDTSSASRDSWSEALAEAKKIAAQPGAQSLRETGDTKAAFATANKTVKAFYSYPFLAHATMEPQVTTAWYRDGQIDLWAPAQTVDSSRPSISRLLGLPLDKVAVHLPRLGGGFGRRLMYDFMTEAALIARRVDSPVKLVWTREDDLQYDYYRVGGFHGFKAAVDKQGQLTAWQQHFISFTSDGKAPVSGGNLDPADFPMNVVANAFVSQTLLPLATRTGPWRAPRSNGIAFAAQSFLHEVAVTAKRDHVELLVELFAKMPQPAANQPGLNPERAIRVIKLAAEKAGWGQKLRSGRGLGLAFYYSHAGHFAEVVDVTVDKRRNLKVNRVTVAGDIGLVVNPLNAEHQVAGSVTDGLSAALGQRITVENGAVQQSNFHDYPLLRMPAAPPVSIHWVDSGYSPTGVGEPALPPLAPALCNAIFAATGIRVRDLPLTLSGFSA